MYCDLTIKNALIRQITEQLNDLGYQDGKFYPLEGFLMNDEENLQALNRLQARYPGISVYQLGEETIKIQLEIPDSILEEYQGRVQVDEDSYQGLSEDRLNQLAVEHQEQFKEFVDDARVSLEQMTKIRDLKTQIFENVPSSIMTRLWNLKKELDKVGDWDGVVKGYMGFLLENRDLVDVAVTKMREISQDDPLAYPKLRQLMQLVNTNRHVFNELNAFLNKYAKDSPINTIAEEVLQNIKEADQIIVRAAKDYSIDILGKDYHATYQQMETELNNYIRGQNQLRNNDPKRNKIIDDNIAKAREEFQKEAPSPENINKVITGENGDTAWFHTYLNANIANPDLIVSGFMNKVKEAYRGVNQVVVDFQNDLAERHQQYLDETGKNDINPERLFENFHEEVPVYYYDQEKGSIEQINEVHLVHDIDPAYYTERSRFNARFSQLREQLNNTQDEEQRAILIDQQRTLGKEYREFRRNTEVKPYVDEYYEIYDLLDEEVNGQSIREIRQPYLEHISGIQRKIRIQNNIPTVEDMEALDRANMEYQALRSTLNKEGDALRVAEILQEYHSRMNEMVRYHISDEKRDAFLLQRKEVERRLAKNEIDREDYDRWIRTNTTRTYSAEYTLRTQTIFRQLNRIADQIARLQNRPIDKSATEAWDELRANVRAFRDHENILNGQLMTEEQILNAKELEERIEQIKKDSIDFLGFTQEQRERKQSLYNDINRLTREKDQAHEDNNIPLKMSLSNQISGLYDEIKLLDQSVINTPQLKQLAAMYKKYMKELASLRKTKKTKYYEAEFNRQLGMWMGQESSVLPPRSFRTRGSTYTILDNGNIEVDGVERTDIDIQGVWRGAQMGRFATSDWFINNHVQRHRLVNGELVPVMEPLYIWRVTEPAKEEDILSEEPNFNWTEREVYDKYKNPDFELNIVGKPKVINRPNQKYRNLAQVDKDYLDYLTNQYLESQNVYNYGQRMGYRLPSIEREFSLFGAAIGGKDKTIKQIKRRFVNTEQDRDEGLGDTSNRQAQFIPVYFRSRIDPDIISTNLIESITQYKVQSIKYENLEKVQPLSQALEDTLEKYTPKSKKLNLLGKKLGVRRQLLQRAGNRRLDTVKAMTDMFLYGEWKKEEKIWGVGKRFDKTFDTLLGAKSFFSLAGTTFQQAANLGNGMFNQLIQGQIKAGKTNFSYKQWAAAYKDLTFRYSTELVGDFGKVGQKSYLGQMLDLFDVFDGKFLNTAGREIETKLARQLFSTDLAFFFKNSVEFSLNVSTFLAFARNYTVDINGTKTPLIEAFEIRNGRLQPKEGFEFTPEIRNDVSNKVTRLNRDINGNYGSLDRALAERVWIGRAIFWMKKFIVPMVLARWGGRRFSLEEGRMIEGYHLSTAKTLVNTAVQLYKDPRNLSTYWDTRPQEQKTALNRTLKEGLMLGALWAIVELIFGFEKDDPERWKKLQKRSWAYNAAFAAIYKLKGEAETFILFAGVDEAQRIQKNLFQEVVPMFSELWKIFYEDIEPIGEWGEDGMLVKYKRDYRHHEKGDYKIVTDLGKLIGIRRSKVDPIEASKNIELSKLR